MLLPQGTIVAVADGEKFNLFATAETRAHPELTAMSEPDISVNAGSGAGHQSSSANPDVSQAAEDGFAGGIAELLNKRVLDGEIADLVIIARSPNPRRASQELPQKIVGGASRRDLKGSHRSRLARHRESDCCGLAPAKPRRCRRFRFLASADCD